MAYNISLDALKLMGDALHADARAFAAVTDGTPPAMMGLPGGEGATRLEVHVADWQQFDPLNEQPQQKDKWGPGPWQDEANALWYSEGGAYGVVLRNPETGTLCGYVGVDQTNPAWNVSADGGNLPEAPGGITKAGAAPLIDHALGLPPGKYHWIGFDTGHLPDDVVPLLSHIKHTLGASSKATYKDLRFVLHHTELLRRRLCIPRDLLMEDTWHHAFAYAGEVSKYTKRKWHVVDNDVVPPALMNVRVDRSDVREVIALEWSELEPQVQVGRQVAACGIFRMHSGQYMVLEARTADSWNSGAGAAKLTRDPNVVERDLLQAIRNAPTTPSWFGGHPLQRALNEFREWRVNGAAKPPTRAELQAVSNALAEAERDFDLAD
jgi:hypothetical protein